MPNDIHVFVAEHPGFGWGLESPQLPELAAGRSTRLELDVALRELIAFGGADNGSRVLVHEQTYRTTDDGSDYAIRVLRDTAHYLDRLALLRQLLDALETDPDEILGAYLDGEHDPVFVVSQQTDKISDLLAQMDDRGDLAVIVLPVGELGFWHTSLVTKNDEKETGRTLDDWNVDGDSTLGDLMTSMSKGKPTRTGHVPPIAVSLH